LKDETAPHVGGEPSGELDPGVRERLAGAARSRSDIYRALAIGFSEPDEDLRDALGAGPPVIAAVETAPPSAGVLVRKLTAAVEWLGADARYYQSGLQTLTAAGTDLPPLPDLAAEYARLFTGPGRAAVGRFASQYLDEPGPDGRPRLYGPATEAALAAYEAEGLAPKMLLGEPGDDIATELEFLGWLCSREERHWSEAETEKALHLRRASDRFLRDHCASWWPAFADAVLSQSRISLYPGFARLLAAHLMIELGYPYAASPDQRTPAADRRERDQST
jgi:TorA maturation chaperone TorD